MYFQFLFFLLFFVFFWCLFGCYIIFQYKSTRLSGGGAVHHLDIIIPKLISSSVSDDSPNIIPDVTSCHGEPGNGWSTSSTKSPQQFISENTVTRRFPVKYLWKFNGVSK